MSVAHAGVADDGGPFLVERTANVGTATTLSLPLLDQPSAQKKIDWVLERYQPGPKSRLDRRDGTGVMMSAFPIQPVSPREFFEETIPALFAEAVLDEAERALDLKIGAVLTDEAGGEDGGDWTLHFVGGELGVSRGRSSECELTVVQSVSNWRAALWEGRPGLVADAVAIVAKSGPNGLRPQGGSEAMANPDAIKGLSEIRGLIEAVVAGEGDEEDWQIGIQVGPGPIPVTPAATILLGAPEADAIRRGELHPIEALMTGKLRLEGDLGLILQLQAVAMLASMPKPTPSRRS